jgi:hypothetical protein
MRKKGGATEKPKTYVTKRGHFMDDLVKSKNFIPGHKYNIETSLLEGAGKEEKKPKEVDKKTKRNTYIDQLIREQELRYIPGPGAHNIIKTDKQIEEELKK